LGFAGNVLGRGEPHTLAALADGSLLASFVSFALHVRGKRASSVAVELAALQRVLSFLASSAPADKRVEIETMRTALRRLSRQLLAQPRRDPPTVEELTRAGKFCSLEQLWAFCDASYDAVDFDDRTPRGARLVHDALVLYLCLREHALKRPTCMWLVKVPGATSSCAVAGCTRPACRGNAWRVGGDAPVLDIVHFKTQRAAAGGKCVVKVEPGSKTARLLAAHTAWGRKLLLAGGQEHNDSLWVSPTRRAFSSGKHFSNHLCKKDLLNRQATFERCGSLLRLVARAVRLFEID
jgi:hypothetical protein